MKCPQHIKPDPDCPECQERKVKRRDTAKAIKMMRRRHQQKIVKMRKLLRQACDILSQKQFCDGVCIGCGSDSGHHNGCRAEAILDKVKDHGLNYD